MTVNDFPILNLRESHALNLSHMSCTNAKEANPETNETPLSSTWMI